MDPKNTEVQGLGASSVSQSVGWKFNAFTNWRLTVAVEMLHPRAPLRTMSRSYELIPVTFLKASWTEGVQEVGPTITGVGEEKDCSTTVEFLSDWTPLVSGMTVEDMESEESSMVKLPPDEEFGCVCHETWEEEKLKMSVPRSTPTADAEGAE
jgi:hypothetical protein